MRKKKTNKIDIESLDYCIVRTYSAGVFAGYVDRNIKGKELTVYEAVRLWQWFGASLSQVSVDGFVDPDKCKIAITVSEVDLKEVIEIIPCTIKAKESIIKVRRWQL